MGLRAPLRNSVMQLVTSLFFAILGIAITVYFGVLTLPVAPAHLDARRLFELDVLEPARALGIPARLIWDGAIGAEQRDIDVDSLRVVWVALRNSGGEPLDWERYVKAPLKFSLNGKGRFLKATRLVDDPEKPNPVPLHLVQTPDEITVSTKFLNPNETINLQIIHNGGANSLRLEGSVLGQRDLALTNASATQTDSNSGVRFIVIPLVTFGWCSLCLVWLRRKAVKERWWKSIVLASSESLLATGWSLVICCITFELLVLVHWINATALLILLTMYPLLTVALVYEQLRKRHGGSQLLRVLVGQRKQPTSAIRSKSHRMPAQVT